MSHHQASEADHAQHRTKLAVSSAQILVHGIGASLLAPGKACLTLPLGNAGVAPGHAPPHGAASAAPPPEEDEEGIDEPPEVKQFMQELGEGSGGRGGAGAGAPEESAPSGAPRLAQSAEIGPLPCGRKDGRSPLRCRDPRGRQGPDHVRQTYPPDEHPERLMCSQQVQAMQRHLSKGISHSLGRPRGRDRSPLPGAGLELALVSGAAGMLSLGMRCIEHACNHADSLLSTVPAGGMHAQACSH